MKNGPVARPEDGPAAPVTEIHAAEHIHRIQEATHPQLDNVDNNNVIQQEVVDVEEFDTTIPHLTYQELECITDNFNLVPVAEKGRKLGAGAFGTVFLGELPRNTSPEDSSIVSIFQKMKLSLKEKVAVKRLNTEKVRY